MVKFVLIGCGRISELHLKAVSEAKDAQLAAVCDIVEEKAAAVAAAHDVPYYLDIAEMLAAVQPQVAIIGTPSGMHGEHAEICAHHGVHVLCEKPIEVTKEKIDRMIAVCEAKGVKLGCIYQRRTYTGAKAVKAAIDKNLLGKILLCDGYFKYSRLQSYYDADAWRGTWELDGGGALMNQCIHGIDMMVYLCGDVHSVTAKCAALTRDIETEDTAVVLVTFKSGAFGVIEGTTSLAEGDETVFDICGDKGRISLGDDSFHKWQLSDNSPPPSITDSLGGKNCDWVSVSEGHTLLVQDMAECVMQGRNPLIMPQDARRAIDIILAIYESSRSDKEVLL